MDFLERIKFLELDDMNDVVRSSMELDEQGEFPRFFSELLTGCVLVSLSFLESVVREKGLRVSTILFGAKGEKIHSEINIEKTEPSIETELFIKAPKYRLETLKIKLVDYLSRPGLTCRCQLLITEGQKEQEAVVALSNVMRNIVFPKKVFFKKPVPYGSYRWKLYYKGTRYLLSMKLSKEIYELPEQSNRYSNSRIPYIKGVFSAVLLYSLLLFGMVYFMTAIGEPVSAVRERSVLTRELQRRVAGEKASVGVDWRIRRMSSEEVIKSLKQSEENRKLMQTSLRAGVKND